MIIRQYCLCHDGYCVIRMPRFATILSVCSVRSPGLVGQNTPQTPYVCVLISQEEIEEEDIEFFVCTCGTPESKMFKHGGDYIGFFTMQYAPHTTETVHHVFVNCV